MSENYFLVQWIIPLRKCSLLIEDLNKINVLLVCIHQIQRQQWSNDGGSLCSVQQVCHRDQTSGATGTCCAVQPLITCCYWLTRYQMEISHRSLPKTAPTLSQQQTFMTCSLRHLCPLTTRACKSACICKVTKLPYLEVPAFLWLF